MALYRPSVPYWTLTMTHASTTGGAVNTDINRFFGVSTAGTAVTTTTDRGFGFPVAGTIVGAMSTLTLGTIAAGTKTSTTAMIALWNRTPTSGGTAIADLGLTHDYTQTVDVKRNMSLNIAVDTSTIYVLRCLIPGYTTTAPSAFVHHVTLFVR